MPDLDACEKRNALRIVAAQSATKLGDVLTNPKTVLTWMLTSLGAPGALLSMLVPVRESGSMLPQVFVSGWVKRVEPRKKVFVAGAFAQALAIAGMGLAALFLAATAAGVAVLLALAVFAVARSFCSISSKDVLGRTIPKGFRGRVGGISNSISGGLSAAAAVGLLVFREQETARFLAWLVLGASLLWVLGGGLYALVSEPEGNEASEGEEASANVLERLALVRDDAVFRRFIIARSLLLGSALASPLLVVLAQRSGGALGSLVGFIVASGLASGTSSFLWGKLADRSSEGAMAAGGLVAGGVAAGAIALAWIEPDWASQVWVWPVVFLFFNIGYAGVRLGRKTWVVDAVEGDRRTDYVSASNTLIAVLILVTGAIHSPLQAWSPLASLGLYGAMCFAGAAVALRLRSVAAGAGESA